jgi:4-hydroxybenzoate polyprenyltransferase
VNDAPRKALRGVGIALAVVVGVAAAIAAVIGIGLLFWLGIKGLFVVIGRAIVDGIKDSINNRS